MNSLSWFLYAADVIPHAGWVFLLMFLFSIPIWMVWWFIEWLKHEDEINYYKRRKRDGDMEKGKVLSDKRNKDLRRPLKHLWIPVLLLLLCVAMPSRTTIYLIAGSEAGEMAVTSEAGQEILDDVHEVIKQQLSSLKGKDDED